jgi:hypothetical protein
LKISYFGFPYSSSYKVFETKKEETSSPLDPVLFSPKAQIPPLKSKTSPSSSNLLLSPQSPIVVTAVKSPSPPCSPTVQNPMAAANAPRNRMDVIVAARYAPLVLPQPVNALPVVDYLKYMPKFIGEEDITAEEHLAAFYSYADNLNIENEDLWIRVLVQSPDGEARKWFRGLTPGSIVGIEDLYDAFLR